MTTPNPSPGIDLRLEAETSNGTAAAALWWTDVPAMEGEKLGVIGEFSAESQDAADGLLERAVGNLRARGCTLAVGPMDGNTWRKYRFVTEAGTEPAFFLEPTNPPEWPVWWRKSGFEPLAEYDSTATNDLTARDKRLAAVRERIAREGVSIRRLDAARFDADLERIYAVSVVSFRDNYLYTPLSEAAFVAQYRSIQPHVCSDLVLIAEHAGHPVGYVFAIPDLAQAKRGRPVDTVIVKTLAVLPGRAYAGLGALLLDEAHAAAHRLGFGRAIHALMHQSNKSRNLSAHYGKSIRRYTLFSKRTSA